ncbi:hypothetical protein VE04_07545 [Pseudogymnoascus sp. 24MN13]|nr:hypothetical protein VE04_07545 [Pseudogymnoascus sp. 24MN13]
MNPSLSTPNIASRTAELSLRPSPPQSGDARALQDPRTASEPRASTLCIDDTILFTPRHPVIPSRRPFPIVTITYDSIRSFLTPSPLRTNIPPQKSHVRIALIVVNSAKMPTIHTLDARDVALQLSKRENWARQEAGVIVVFCIVGVVALGVTWLCIHKWISAVVRTGPRNRWGLEDRGGRVYSVVMGW